VIESAAPPPTVEQVDTTEWKGGWKVTMTSFAPLRPVKGYFPLEDYGLIGDGTTAALVGRDGSVDWLCLPRFDSPPLFMRILDVSRGGAFKITVDDFVESRHYYEDETAVLVTELRGKTGLVRITDALGLSPDAELIHDVRSSRSELVRSVEVLDGSVSLQVHVDPYGGAVAEREGEALRLRCHERPALDLLIASTKRLDGLKSTLALRQGERCCIALRWNGWSAGERVEDDERMASTRGAWRKWMDRLRYSGPQEALVRRSAITLKLLDHFENGAIVAAPTSSLPEAIGGPRNWDYRYTWIRDAAFSVYAFNRIGMEREAAGFLRWVLDAVDSGDRPRVLYDLDRTLPPPEREDDKLEGYRGSRPVRWGNAAADQRQHDVFGEILDCAYQWAAHHGSIDEALWGKLHEFVEMAGREWRQPDHGIWEVRVPGRVFTYSAALCHVALTRGAILAERHGLPGDITAWRAEAARIKEAVLEESWSEKLNSMTEHVGTEGGLDASLLSLPLRRVLPADHPRMVATTEAVARHLGAGDGLLYRYDPDESPDGLAGHEGAFLLCSFWLVDNLARQGRTEEAATLYDSLCARANPVGLLPEQIDPGSGAFLGNFPQAFSHVGLISSGINLARSGVK
jgi:alpha,alpha-trehalase